MPVLSRPKSSAEISGMEAVKTWLNSPIKNYSSGVELYLIHGKDPQLARLFTAEGESDFKRKKLQEVLKQLWNAWCRPAAPQQALLRLEKPQSPISHRGWPVTLDIYLLALHTQWRPLYAEMMQLQHRVYEVALLAEKTNDTNAELTAHTITFRILELDELCDALYAKRDYYLVHSRPKDEAPAPIVTDPVKLAIELKNVERYIRDYKIKVAQKPDNDKWAGKLKQFEERYQQLRHLLKLDDGK